MGFYHPKKGSQIELINELTENSNSKKVNFDSINYISTFELNKNDTLNFTLGMDTRKMVLLFVKEILIKNEVDSIRIKDYETIIELLTNKENNLNEYFLTEKFFE